MNRTDSRPIGLATRAGVFARSDAALAMVARAAQGGAMGLGAIFVIWQTSPTVQGFYFAFISFGILLQLCDFGLSYASLQAASHLLAIGRIDQLPGLASRALRINLVVTVLATVVVAALGAWIFARAPAEHGVAWMAAWAAYVVGVGLNHLSAPYIFVVEGGLSVTRAWRFRLIQEVTSGLALLVVLSCGQGLWALVAYFWVRCVLGVWWMRTVRLAPHMASGPAFSLQRWRDELWPFQWRVGLGAIGTYLVSQAFGPILFALRGPAEAGRFSLSLSVMTAIVMVTTAWPISQAAHFGVLLGRRQARDFAQRWNKLLLQSTAFAALGALTTVIAFIALRTQAPAVMARFAGPTTTGLLIASAVCHHVIACLSVVVRSERRDPLLWLGVVGGLVTLSLMTFAALHDELVWIAVAYFLCTAATVPIATVVYRRFATRQRDSGGLPTAA